MKRLWPALILLPVLAYGDIKRGDYNAKSTTLAIQASGCTTVGDTDCTNIGKCSSATSGGLCSATDAAWFIGEFTSFVLTVSNTGVSNVVSDVLVELSADGTNYELFDSAYFDELATTTTKSMQFSGNSRRWIRVNARSASGTTVVVSIAAHDG